MPFFKTTENIFKTPDQDELYDPNLFDSSVIQYPFQEYWDYKREMKIEDVDIWEQIYFESGGTGLYAAWSPYAEFYMITKNIHWGESSDIETFYGKLAWKKAYIRARQLGMPIFLTKKWVEPEDMWLYE